MNDFSAHYIDLLKRAISNFLYLGTAEDFADFNVFQHYEGRTGEWRIDVPSRPATLLTKGQLDLVERCFDEVTQAGVAGDVIEAGVWRGGTVMLLRALLTVREIDDRAVYAADSFSGIPLNTRFRHDTVDSWPDRWACTRGEFERNLQRFSLLDNRIRILGGAFEDTLPSLGNARFALIRLDSDSHDSVMTSLEQLYPRLSPGGIVIIDDWHLTGCRFAVNAYRERERISDPISVEHGNGYWRKAR